MRVDDMSDTCRARGRWEFYLVRNPEGKTSAKFGKWD